MPTDGEDGAGGGDDATSEPSDADVVETAATAAENVIFSRFSASELTDFDVTVAFEDGVLDVDVYVNAGEGNHDEDQVADDAALAAQGAVDDLF